MKVFSGIFSCFIACVLSESFSAAASEYAIVTPASIKDDWAWQGVVDALAKKHGAPIVTYDKNVADAREKLAALAPRYVAFVVRPEEAGRQFVIDAHRFLRKLNDDPYTDVIWGIVTGHEASDAMKIVDQNEPLTIHKGAAGCGIPMGVFDEARTFSEGEACASTVKTADGKVEKLKVEQDTTKALVETFNDYKPDLFMTSGHASERNWQIGYSYKNGYFVCKNGILAGFDMKKQVHKINSPNPKIYLPLGNCLMGHVVDKDAMALAFMSSGGVRQMCGYVVSTWYGYGGWGVQDYFSQPGRFSFAEAVFLNNQALVNKLEREFPDKARMNVNVSGIEHNPKLLDEIAAALGYKDFDERAKTNVGLIYDRDVVAFYGDPKWDARMSKHEQPWEQTLSEKDGVFTFELTSAKGAKPGRPPAAILPRQIGSKFEVIEGKEFEPAIGRNFVLLPKLTNLEAGKSYKVIFKEVK